LKAKSSILRRHGRMTAEKESRKTKQEQGEGRHRPRFLDYMLMKVKPLSANRILANHRPFPVPWVPRVRTDVAKMVCRHCWFRQRKRRIRKCSCTGLPCQGRSRMRRSYRLWYETTDPPQAGQAGVVVLRTRITMPALLSCTPSSANVSDAGKECRATSTISVTSSR